MSDQTNFRPQEPVVPDLAAGLPVLRNGASVDERAGLMREFGESLAMFWTFEFNVAIASGRIDARRLLGVEQALDAQFAGVRIADRIVSRIATAETLDEVKPWADIIGWWTWMIGSQARTSERYSLRLPVGMKRDRQDSVPDTRGSERKSVEELYRLAWAYVQEWSSILEEVVDRTGVHALEAYWLWATLLVRKQLIEVVGQALEEQGAGRSHHPHHLETDRDALRGATPSPGAEPSDRTRRSRGGAVACFRFNLAALRRLRFEKERGEALRLLPDPVSVDSTALRRAREIYLSPADGTFPYRPQTTSRRCPEEFETVVTAVVVAIGQARDEKSVLWADVLRCGINRESAQLLPRAHRDTVQKRWTSLVSIGEEEPACQ